MKVLRKVLAFLLRDASVAVSYRLDFLLRTLGMTFQVVVLYFLSLLIGSHESLDQWGGYLPFATIGTAVLIFFQTCFTSFSKAIQREQQTGTLEAMLMTPVGIPTIVIGSSLWSFLWSVMEVSLYVYLAGTFFDFELKGSVVGAALFLALLTLFVGSLGIISASFMVVFKKGDPLGFFVGSISALLGGAVFPISILPLWLQKVCYLHPLTYGLDGLRSILLLGKPLAAVSQDCLVLLGCTGILLPFSLFCFSQAIKTAKRDGSLLQY